MPAPSSRVHSLGPGGPAVLTPAVISACSVGPWPQTTGSLDCCCLDCPCFSDRWLGVVCHGLKVESFLHLPRWGSLRALFSSGGGLAFLLSRGHTFITHRSFALCHLPFLLLPGFDLFWLPGPPHFLVSTFTLLSLSV